jgi:arsenite methyltransferase
MSLSEASPKAFRNEPIAENCFHAFGARNWLPVLKEFSSGNTIGFMETTHGSESAVQRRYSQAARAPEASLCCPVDYDSQYLRAIPREVVEKDYGCGNPARFLNPGETVLDLGSGTGKICFIASQIVGPQGRVIGVDMTEEMLEVARRNAPLVAATVGFANVEFRRGRIQDLALDLDKFDAALRRTPIQSAADYLRAEELAEELRIREPLIAANSVDVVVSNCVLNLVDARSKGKLFEELFRVVRPGGRAVISDIVAAREVPEEMRRDPELWSGCISGAFTESGFIDAFASAGFQGIHVVKWETTPWRVIGEIEFRSITVEAFKPSKTEAKATARDAIYLGPFLEVTDDAGQKFVRGRRRTISGVDFQRLSGKPYQEFFAFAGTLQLATTHHKTAPSHDFRLSPAGRSTSCC